MFTPPAQRLVFHAKQHVEVESFELPELTDGEICVKCQYSLMSTGTENIVFNRLFDAGTHWDHWVQYPFYPGYAAAGIVEKVSPDVTTVSPGDRVVYRAGHSSHAVLKAAACYPVPKGIPSESAIWFALAKIAFHGAHAAQYRLGDTVLIIGAGPIGQMSLRWARAAGALRIIVVDPVAERSGISTAGGAHTYLASTADLVRDDVLAANDGQLPGVIIDSTGHPAAFAAALNLAAQHGRVVILGDTGQPARQALTCDVIMKGLSITGVHDGHQLQGWNEGTMTALFFPLVQDKRFSLEGLNSHIFTPAQCMEAYTTANRDRGRTMGILFDWNT